MSAGQNKSAKLEGAGGEWEKISISKVTDTIDYVANGSFESLRNNVTYKDSPDYAILIRLVDYNAGWRGRFVYVDKISYDFLRKSALVPGDIIIANVGANAGTVFRVPELNTHMTLGPNAVLCRPKNENILQKKFLYYYLVSSDGQNLLQTILSGSAQPKFNKTDFRSLLIPIPPLEEQRAIAHILGTLDDKIELNRRTNETLEAMAQALFKFWFVDFGPVRAKMEGRWRRGQSLPGLPAHLFDLFPDRLVDSELGEIPEGWEVSQFANTIEIIGGGTPKTSVAEYWGDEIPWFSVADTPSKSDMWVMDTEKKVTHKGIENSSTKILPIGTTIISARGTVGKVALVGIPMAMNQSCYGLCGKMGTQGIFNYFVIRELISVLQQNAHGSVFDTITRDTLGNITVVTPPLDIIDKFEIYTITLTNSIRENLNQSHTLATIRDTLLPKLISGKLRVKDTEKIIGRTP